MRVDYKRMHHEVAIRRIFPDKSHRTRNKECCNTFGLVICIMTLEVMLARKIEKKIGTEIPTEGELFARFFSY